MAATGKKADGQRPIVLGRVSGVYGVKGWVKLHSYTDPRAGILDYRDCLLGTERGWQAARISEGKTHGKAVIARFAGVCDRDAAAGYVGCELAVHRRQLPEPGVGHYYWADLEGLTVVHKDGTELGKVAHMLATGANDVMVVQGDSEILIPFVTGSVVLDVDLAGGTIRVDWEWE